MKPYLSIVIPAYNAEHSLATLLTSIGTSQDVVESFEVIIVDDKSPQALVPIVTAWQKEWGKQVTKVTKKIYNKTHNKKIIGKDWVIYVITQKRNQGPAHARNTGAKVAKGEVLVFLDSDVELFPDTLYQIISAFQTDPDLFALTGVWDKQQRSTKFFPRFKALRDWSYWINERDQRGYYYLFSTRIASIRRALFERLGGFDESYGNASVEDIELTYRIARRYAVVFDPKVRVRHEFEDFFPIARKYFLRSKEWNRLYAKRGKFDPVATTRSEALTALSGLGFIGSGFLALLLLALFWVSRIWLGSVLSLYLLILWRSFIAIAAGLLVIHLFGVRKFMLFAYREEGIVFMIKSFVMGLILYIVISLGALAFHLERIQKVFSKFWGKRAGKRQVLSSYRTG